MSEGYNGWKNYPTWATFTLLSNDEEVYSSCLALAEEALEDPHPRYTLKQNLKKGLCEQLEDENFSLTLFQDLLEYAMEAIDWYEIADSFLEDLKEIKAKEKEG